MRMKKPIEKIRFSVIIHAGTSEEASGLPLAAFSSSMAMLVEKRSAFTPSDIAWPRVPTPRRIGSLKMGYFSLTRGSGACSVAISPFDRRTATQ